MPWKNTVGFTGNDNRKKKTKTLPPKINEINFTGTWKLILSSLQSLQSGSCLALQSAPFPPPWKAHKGPFKGPYSFRLVILVTSFLVDKAQGENKNNRQTTSKGRQGSKRRSRKNGATFINTEWIIKQPYVTFSCFCVQQVIKQSQHWREDFVMAINKCWFSTNFFPLKLYARTMILWILEASQGIFLRGFIRTVIIIRTLARLIHQVIRRGSHLLILSFSPTRRCGRSAVKL